MTTHLPPHTGTPDAEIDISTDLLRDLLADQFPDLADLPLQPVDHGWDNVMIRIGDDLVARLPRRQMGADIIVNEQQWLPKLASRLKLRVPLTKKIGQPHAGEKGGGYPWPWSIVPWIDGTPADLSPLNRDQGRVLADFLTALHKPAPEDAPHNPYRGVHLNTRADGIEDAMIAVSRQTNLITRPIAAIWQQALSVDIDVPNCWIHGDLHERNMLADDEGNITGIIDWGDMCAGDRASDLACVWTLLGHAEVRADVMEFYDATPETWQRAAGWAVMFGVVLLRAGLADDPRMAAMGTNILARLEADMG